MTVLDGIAYYQNRRDEVPNQELAAKLARTRNKRGIAEIAENLRNENAEVQADCLKVLYEVGYIDPSLVSGCVDQFLQLLRSSSNRLVWGAMIGLSTIAELQSAAIGRRADEIIETMKAGSVITVDHGVKVLAIVASREREANEKLVAFLFNHLKTCRPKDVAQHSEKMMVAVDRQNKARFMKILISRMDEYSDSQLKRITRVLGQAEAK